MLELGCYPNLTNTIAIKKTTKYGVICITAITEDM